MVAAPTRQRPDERRGDIAILSSARSFRSLSRHLAQRGWEPMRVETIRTVPVRIRSPQLWRRYPSPADLWIVSSRAVVDSLLRYNSDWLPVLRKIPQVVAIGRDTARALISIGISRVRTSGQGGTPALLRVLGRVRGRLILYLRSDRAGPDLAARLRRAGAKVRERVVYRTRLGRPLNPAARRRLGGAPVWVVASPSSLFGFRRVAGEELFQSRRTQVHCFAIGKRTARALRSAGVRRVSVSPESSERGFTRFLVQALGDAFTKPR